jgi:hypothetical protein
VRPHRPALRHVAGALITASIVAGISTIAVRAGGGSSLAMRLLEAATLLLAAVAYLSYVLAHHSEFGEVVTRLVLVTAFALWAIVQLAPTFSGAALLNDLTILLFVADLAILLSPAR